MSIIITILLLLAGFAILLKGADWFVESSASIAATLGVSKFVIGFTLVAFGTSLPEMAVSVVASFLKASEIAAGNVVGSNIANIGMVLGIAALIFTIKIHKTDFKHGLIMFLVSVLCFGLIWNGLNRIEGAILFLCLVVYVRYLLKNDKKGKAEAQKDSIARSILFCIIGLAGVILGSHLLVNSSISIAELLGIPQIVIGMTIVALGTSLPELVTSLVAAKKGMQEIAIGNIIGSNMFNISAVLGLSAIVRPITAIPRLFFFDMPVMLGITALMLLFLRQKKEIHRWQGAVFVALYSAFVVAAFLL
ncbi:MAG: calcium/sodium antiporter [archaeon]